MTKRTVEATSTIQDDASDRVQHEHIGVANKADVSSNTPCGTTFVAESATATLCPSCSANKEHHQHSGCGCGH